MKEEGSGSEDRAGRAGRPTAKQPSEKERASRASNPPAIIVALHGITYTPQRWRLTLNWIWATLAFQEVVS